MFAEIFQGFEIAGMSDDSPEYLTISCKQQPFLIGGVTGKKSGESRKTPAVQYRPAHSPRQPVRESPWLPQAVCGNGNLV
jgi:hypothetical protein